MVRLSIFWFICFAIVNTIIYTVVNTISCATVTARANYYGPYKYNNMNITT